ncbi:hypothetical protein CCR82_06210 [Halochromatium salexigens]|uniref:Uncharacterized protein n=1 Tax=Halochromatium salexigens TaxID=49447 RepID=A0AAJ0UF19_HALSE|nr:hypothetical protein [Halochromatium salexigens]
MSEILFTIIFFILFISFFISITIDSLEPVFSGLNVTSILKSILLLGCVAPLIASIFISNYSLIFWIGVVLLFVNSFCTYPSQSHDAAFFLFFGLMIRMFFIFGVFSLHEYVNP